MKGSKNVANARFNPAVDEDGAATVLQLTPQQVVMTVKDLTAGGYLRAADKRTLRSFLEDH